MKKAFASWDPNISGPWRETATVCSTERPATGAPVSSKSQDCKNIHHIT